MPISKPFPNQPRLLPHIPELDLYYQRPIFVYPYIPALVNVTGLDDELPLMLDETLEVELVAFVKFIKLEDKLVDIEELQLEEVEVGILSQIPNSGIQPAPQ